MRSIAAFLENLQLPQDCVQEISACEAVLQQKAQTEYAAALSYFLCGEADRAQAKALLQALSDRAEQHPYTSDMAVVSAAFIHLEETYRRLGLPQALYENACRDARCKLWECKTVYGVWGTFVAPWFLRWFVPSRFALGRLQFETCENGLPEGAAVRFDEPGGFELTSGETMIRVHIPSTGEPLTEALRMDAYRRAWEFYKDGFKDGLVPFTCKSWLLYEKNPEILEESSNIVQFMRDFYVLPEQNDAPLGDLWRIFGMPNETPFARLPEDTSLRRRYKAYLLAGGLPGEGTGVFLFDGKHLYNQAKIIKKPLI